MARFNNVELYGQVLADPFVSVKDNGTSKATARLRVIDQNRDSNLSGAGPIYSAPLLYSENPEVIDQMKTWKQGDMVLMRGFVTTVDVSRGSRCVHCGNVETHPGEVTFISPIFGEVIRSGLTEKEGMEDLAKHREISNLCMVVGYVCEDPRLTDKPKIHDNILSKYSAKKLTSFQLAVNRKIFLGGDPSVRTDYPHIISIGRRAEEDKFCLKQGSLAMVDGMIVTRDVRKFKDCPCCKQKYEYSELITEIFSLGTEYMNNFTPLQGTIEDEKERVRRELYDAAIDSIRSAEDDEELISEIEDGGDDDADEVIS
jgi:single-stranded DNA-binding protein